MWSCLFSRRTHSPVLHDFPSQTMEPQLGLEACGPLPTRERERPPQRARRGPPEVPWCPKDVPEGRGVVTRAEHDQPSLHPEASQAESPSVELLWSNDVVHDGVRDVDRRSFRVDQPDQEHRLRSHGVSVGPVRTDGFLESQAPHDLGAYGETRPEGGGSGRPTLVGGTVASKVDRFLFEVEQPVRCPGRGGDDDAPTEYGMVGPCPCRRHALQPIGSWDDVVVREYEEIASRDLQGGVEGPALLRALDAAEDLLATDRVCPACGRNSRCQR